MKITTPITVLLVMLGGCTSQASRLDAYAQSCEEAVHVGRLDVAEEMCLRALGESDKDILTPAVRSQRLYDLARIKRQRGKFSEAGELLGESLATEETLSGADSPGVTRRLTEMSLILAGQGQWEEGAQVLERALPLAHQLTENERASLGNIIKRYAVHLKNNGQATQAARLEAAAVKLIAD
ncbi:MAG: tetratricopeptide repeat protein [Gammaproteobacteria bacterium]|nr:tetratricopeptide repeat protein [Gammaproteobacteria bacterium]